MKHLLWLFLLGVALAQTTTPPPPVVTPPIVYPCVDQNVSCAPGPPEWTPRLYATVPTLTSSGQEFSPTTLLGGIQPTHSILTYILYQINVNLLNAGNGSCCHVLSDSVSPGFSIVAKLQQGLCFALTQEPGGMSMAEMKLAIGSPTVVNGMLRFTTPVPYGGGAGGTPSGPGCAYPPPMVTPADIAAAQTTIYVF